MFLLFVLTSCSQQIESESGSLSVHFCPQEKCEQIFTEQLAAANHSLDCALYEIDDVQVWKQLDLASNRITVRVVMDGDYKNDAQNRTYVRFDNSKGLMHNKFCVIDGQTVTSGSMNPTVSDIFKNFNNLVIIDSLGIAKNYETEFEELWKGQFRAGNPNEKSLFLVNNTFVEQYFCPDDNCEKHVIDTINSANTSVRFMTFSFTSFPIATALIAAKNRGVSVEGLYEKRQVNAYSVFSKLQNQGISAIIAKNPNDGQLHHKVFIIDNDTVITGSYNPTGNGDKGNDENIIIIHDEEIAQQFLDNYNQIKNGST